MLLFSHLSLLILWYQLSNAPKILNICLPLISYYSTLSFFSEASFHSLTFRKLTGSEMSLCCSIWWSTPSQGTLGDKNEMQSVQPTSPDSRHYHTDESPRSIKGCCLFTKLCTYTSSTSFLLSPSLFFPLSCIFLNGCLHCSLSFLLYLHLTGFCLAEVPSRHRSLADIPCLIIVEWPAAPSHAYCYLSVWVMLGDKTLAKTLTVSRPP